MIKVRALLTQCKMEFSMLRKKTIDNTLNEGMGLRNLSHVLQSPGIDPRFCYASIRCKPKIHDIGHSFKSLLVNPELKISPKRTFMNFVYNRKNIKCIILLQ